MPLSSSTGVFGDGPRVVVSSLGLRSLLLYYDTTDHYSYDGLPPDEIVANVQSALQDLGYYLYEVDGIFGH